MADRKKVEKQTGDLTGFSIRTDSHNIIDEQTYTVEETVVYDEDNSVLPMRKRL